MALSEILCYVVEGRFHIPPNPVAVSLAILAIVVSLYLTKYHSKKIRRTLPFLFLVVTVGTLGIYGQERSSPAGSPVPISTLSPAQPTQALSPDERIRRLEEEVNLALALKDERIQSINERSENIYKWLQFFGAFAALVLVFFTARDIVQRWKEQKRQKGIDEIVMGMMKLQKSGAERQDRLGELQLKQMETSPNQQFQAVENVNQVIEVVRKTLAFRLEQEEKFVEALKEIERIREERDKIKKQKLAQALGICEHFHTMSRMEFATLTLEQYKRGLRLQSLVNDLDETLTKQGFDIAGSLLYTCGVIAYYDNDVIEAKAYLDRAALRRAADHDGELTTNDDYRNRFAFIHYFRALIQKNWGELSEAQYEIQQSVRLLENKAGEYLAPVTRAEILSYIPGDEERCRGELMALIQRLNELADSLKKDGASLDANQRRLRNRMLVLCGNTYFEQKEFSKALEQYGKAIEFNANDYYALVSAAQCERTLGDSEGAAIHFGQTLEAIDRSGDLGRKREQITRAVIAVIASIAAKEIDDRANCERYTREAREVLRGNLTVDGLSPKFFSPATKRLVSASELLKMLEV